MMSIQVTSEDVSKLLSQIGPTAAWLQVIEMFKLDHVTALLMTSPVKTAIFREMVAFESVSASIYITAINAASSEQVVKLVVAHSVHIIISACVGGCTGSIPVERCREVFAAHSDDDWVCTALTNTISHMGSREFKPEMMELIASVIVTRKHKITTDCIDKVAEFRRMLNKLPSPLLDALFKLYPRGCFTAVVDTKCGVSETTRSHIFDMAVKRL